MRKPLISGNWKMNLNHFEAIQTRAEAGTTC
jgi:triosephosphate isomerase